MLRLFGSQRGNECGPIAVYNLARLLNLPSARGGYVGNSERLKRALRYNPKNGCTYRMIWRAVNTELRGSGFRIRRRRATWGNIVSQLVKAEAPSVALCIWDIEPGLAHITPVWVPYGRRYLILGSNFIRGYTISPLYIGEGGRYWPTYIHPDIMHRESKLREFWQATPI